MNVEFPSKLAFLFQPARFKSIKGGRDGGKSWGVARALLELGAVQKEFVVCARETMESIKDSVHRLLVEQIETLKMTDQYGIEKSLIWHRRTGTEFVFRGLKNPDALKSLEGATIAWIEEAQTVSNESWRKVIPTVRRPNSEIWLTWNPELETDATYRRFVLEPPPGLVSVHMNFSDNPWASEVLKAEREQCRREKPDEYAHVWLGQCRKQMEGAIYANELRLAESQGRIGSVPHQAGCPVYTGWDLGDSDMTAIWFIQPIMGQYRVIDYHEENHKPMSHYLTVLEAKGYRYATDYFPWDASSKILIGSLEETMRQRGRTVQVLPRMSREVGIDRVREMLGTCWFDEKACMDGLQRLRYYRYGDTNAVDPVTGRPVITRQPIHDDNSHGADALRSFACGYRMPKPKPEGTPPGSRPIVQPPRMPGQYTPFG
jgi:phage terminase large subunit